MLSHTLQVSSCSDSLPSWSAWLDLVPERGFHSLQSLCEMRLCEVEPHLHRGSSEVSSVGRSAGAVRT
jgi:hypothetical protein